jgi:hypothetical protein
MVTHIDVISEKLIYKDLENLNLTGVVILDVNVLAGGQEVPYLKIPITRLARLVNIEYIPK